MSYPENSQTTASQLMAKIGQELRPSQLVPNLTAGLVTGLLEIVVSISFAALIFSGVLAPFLASAVGYFLLTTVIFLVILTLLTSYPGVLGAAQDIPAAILGVAAVSIIGRLDPTTTDQEMFLTILATISLAAILTGLFLWGLGQFKLGGLVRFLPYPVIGGFLAGTGWLLTIGAIGTMTNQPFGPVVFQMEHLVHWLPGLIFALGLMGILSRSKHWLVIPISVISGTVLFFVVVLFFKVSLTELSTAGWLLGPFPEGNLWQPFSLSDLALVQWPAIGGQVFNIITIMIMSAVALLLNGTGLEIATRRDMDMNHELKAAGVANILSGLMGGTVGFHQLSTSTVNYKMGVRNRLPGLITAVVCAATLVFGASTLALFPRVIMGGLLLFLGLSFLKEWVIDAWFMLPKLDYAVVVTILLVTAIVGFLEAVGVGLLAAILLFVVNYSRIDVVRHELTGATQQSRVTRSPQQYDLLREYGEQIYILRLQGFIFFGTADNLVNKVRARFDDGTQPAVCTIILDFRRVTAIDSTAGLSFNKLKQLAEARSVTLIMTELSPKIRQQLGQNDLGENGRFQIFPDLDYGLAWCEEQILAAHSNRQSIDETVSQQLYHLLADSEKVNLLLPHLTRRSLPAGHYLIHQGDPPDSLYFIESGQVTAQLEKPNQEPVRLQTMGGGHVVGEIGFYLRGERSAAVITDEPSVIYELTLETMQKMEREDAEAASILHQVIVQLLAARVTHLVDAVDVLQR